MKEEQLAFNFWYCTL